MKSKQKLAKPDDKEHSQLFVEKAARSKRTKAFCCG
jgi:hypothetical protein